MRSEPHMKSRGDSLACSYTTIQSKLQPNTPFYYEFNALNKQPQDTLPHNLAHISHLYNVA